MGSLTNESTKYTFLNLKQLVTMVYHSYIIVHYLQHIPTSNKGGLLIQVTK